MAIGEDGKTYYIKGQNGATAFSEVAGCRLAAATGLRVPAASICTLGDGLYAGVESVPNPQRNVRPWLRDLQRINNSSDLFSVIAVDTWLTNDDRNMGNLVGSSLGDGRIDIFMIDFEKSRTLAANPFIGSGSVEPKRLWPRDELGGFLRRIRPLRVPGVILDRIKEFSQQQISDLVLPVAAELPFVYWQDSSVEVLFQRAQNIDRLVGAVWDTN